MKWLFLNSSLAKSKPGEIVAAGQQRLAVFGAVPLDYDDGGVDSRHDERFAAVHFVWPECRAGDALDARFGLPAACRCNHGEFVRATARYQMSAGESHAQCEGELLEQIITGGAAEPVAHPGEIFQRKQDQAKVVEGRDSGIQMLLETQPVSDDEIQGRSLFRTVKPRPMSFHISGKAPKRFPAVLDDTLDACRQ